MVRVAVVGALGRMGTVTCETIEQRPDLELVAAVGRGGLDAVWAAHADVAVEFSTPRSVKDNTIQLLDHGVHVVVGTSGLSPDDLAEVERHTGGANCAVVPNFAIGAVLLMRFAEQAATLMDSVEIIELHHAGKADAPSGTAKATARRIAEARRAADPDDDPDDDPAIPGPDVPARGQVVDGVTVHSVRLPGLVASQEVVFGAQGQTLTLRHDSIDRTSFMPGVLLAINRIPDLPGLTVGLDALL
jgi:4-hydroxy-tetrahydrodipicolinate reductase